MDSEAVEKLFIETLADLRARVEESPNPYRLLRSAGLIRHLILDGEPLMTAANRRARLKLTFTYRAPIVPNAAQTCDLYWSSDGVDPKYAGSIGSSSHIMLGRPGMSLEELAALPDRGMIDRPRVTAGRDLFLATRVGVCDGHVITVRTLIRAVAHALGGVHHGDTGDDAEMALVRNVGQQIVREVDGFLLTLRTVGIVVVEGLAPLDAALRALDVPHPGT